jgi:molecular chaperone DnaK
MNGQTGVDIKVLQGERQFARDNKLIGNFRLSGIRRAPAGVPKIEVTFDIDANGIVHVSAKDLDTGKQQGITITSSTNLSEADIQRAMREAVEYAASDGTRMTAWETVDEAGKLITESQAKLKAAKRMISKQQKYQINNDIFALGKLLRKSKPEKMTESDIANLKNAMEQLKQSTINI